MNRLSPCTLAALPQAVARPRYDRARLQARIVHIGVGAFHRAHQAWYTDAALNTDGGDWGIIGASLRSATAAEQLNPQQGLYTVVSQDGNDHCQVVASLLGVINAFEQPQRLIAAIAAPEASLVTLTITEKGYYHDPASGELRLAHSDIQADLAAFPGSASTALGFLACGLYARWQAGLAGLTVLSCDNLPLNGRLLRRALLAFVRQAQPALAAWIEAAVSFPCSMVDRIVPASTPAKLDALSHTLGVDDAAAVFTEPFSQWVIEDDFVAGRPAWHKVGVQFAADVVPYETLKLRLLNGCHSLLAYLGYLAGYEFVHQAVAFTPLRQILQHYMEHEVTPVVTVPQGFDLAAYQAQLLQRFANPALQHRTAQIAMDGSQKIPQRWLASLSELLSQNLASDCLSLALAGWIRYLRGYRDNGEGYAIADPLAAELQAISGQYQPADPAQVAAVLAYVPVFGDLLQRYPGLTQAVGQHYSGLCAAGVRGYLQQFAARLGAGAGGTEG